MDVLASLRCRNVSLLWTAGCNANWILRADWCGYNLRFQIHVMICVWSCRRGYCIGKSVMNYSNLGTQFWFGSHATARRKGFERPHFGDVRVQTIRNNIKKCLLTTCPPMLGSENDPLLPINLKNNAPQVEIQNLGYRAIASPWIAKFPDILQQPICQTKVLDPSFFFFICPKPVGPMWGQTVYKVTFVRN